MCKVILSSLKFFQIFESIWEEAVYHDIRVLRRDATLVDGLDRSATRTKIVESHFVPASGEIKP